MTAGRPTLATAWIGLVPTLDGARGAVERELDGVDTQGAGNRAGARFSTGFRLALAAGAVAIGAGIRAALSEASDLNESINAVNVSWGESSEAVQQLGRDAADALGLSNVDFNALAVQFSAFTNTVAGPGGDAVDILADLTGRASDFASVMNLEVSEAATLFQSGLAGETEPLRRYGIDLSAATVESYALANGIGTAGMALTEQQKVQARYALLMEATSRTQGDFANTSTEFANAQRILRANTANLAAELGTRLLPVMKTLVEWGLKIVDWIAKNVEWLGPLALGLTAASVAMWAVNAAMSANPIALVVGAIAALAAGLAWFFTKTETGREAWEKLSAAFSYAWEHVIKPVIDAIVAAWQWAWDNVLQPVFTLIVEAISLIGSTFLWLWENIISPVVNFVVAAFEVLKNAFQAVADFFGAVVETIGDLFSRVTDLITRPFQLAFDGIMWLWDHTVGAVWQQLFGGSNPKVFSGTVGKNISSQALANIPAMASGAVVTRPTLAMIGEGREPEAVLPLSRLDSMLGDDRRSGPVVLAERSIRDLASAILAGADRVARGRVDQFVDDVVAGSRQGIGQVA